MWWLVRWMIASIIKLKLVFLSLEIWQFYHLKDTKSVFHDLKTLNQLCKWQMNEWTVDHICSSTQDVMSVDDESTSCYCLMDLTSCHLLLDQPGSYALVGEPLTQAAIKRLKLAVFGSMEAGSMKYSLRVYCVDDTPHAFQVRKGSVIGFHCVCSRGVKSRLFVVI